MRRKQKKSKKNTKTKKEKKKRKIYLHKHAVYTCKIDPRSQSKTGQAL